MEVVGDCLFQSIASVLNEVNNTNIHNPIEQRQAVYDYFINSSKEELIRYITIMADENIVLYEDEEIDQLTDIDEDSKITLKRNKLQNMIDNNFREFAIILRNMMLQSDYWGTFMI